MGTTAEKLTYLNTTKQKIKDGLNVLGAGITDNDTFRSYANALADRYDELPKVTGTGTVLELTPTKKGKMQIGLKGNSSQFSTTGANILNNMNYSLGNISNTGGDISSTNTYRFNEYVPIGSQTTFYLLKRLVAVYYDENKNYISSNSTQNLTLTTPQNTAFVRFRTFAGDFDTFNNTDYMVSLSSITSYEPFTDGPAPNPSYPYSVKSVTGENSLIIQNANLFDGNYIGAYIGGSTDNNFVISANARTAVIKCKPNTTYTIKKFENSNRFTVDDYPTYPSNNTKLNRLAKTEINNELTVTTNSNANYLFVYVSSTSETAEPKITITQTSVAPSEFIPYGKQTYQLSLGNIELNSSPDGTISDEIRGTLDNWVKREYIGKIVFDGSEGWSVGGVGTNPYVIAINGLKPSISSGSNPSYVYCNYFRGISYDDRATGGDNIVYSVVGTPARLYFRNTYFANLTSWENFLQEKYNNGNPVIAIYVKSSYTDIPITDTTLINQLNDIYENAKSYNGTTNITSTYEDGNEQMIIEASALKSWNDSNE